MTEFIARLTAIAAFAALSIANQCFAQVTQAEALAQSASGATVPLTKYTIKTTRGTFSGLLVGGNPFLENPSKITIDAVLVPLIISIIKPDGTLVTFDPTEPNPCDGNVSAEYRFRHSPLVVASDLIFNGVSVGHVQYIDGFMRAQFWDAPAAGSPNRSSYYNPLNWSFASGFPLPLFLPQQAVVTGTPCNPDTGADTETGIVTATALNSQIENFAIPFLKASGVISPTKFVLFLTKRVEGAKALTPTPSGISGGQHLATGSPVQTWARAAYYKSNDVLTASHEIGEWMNDPLVNNPTPSWGHIGQVKQCSGTFEVGDPLNRISMPKIKMDNYEYHVQELAFFSWFYNSFGMPSYGADGKFSGKGSFTGPSWQACPPGGTYDAAGDRVP